MIATDPVIRYARQPVAPYRRMPAYADWLRKVSKPRPIPKGRPLRIPNGETLDVARYVRQFNELNNLKGTP